MAEYNVDILVKAKIQQAERALDTLKKKIDSIAKNPVIKVGAKGIQDIKTYANALKDLGLKGAAARGGLAAIALQLGKFGTLTTKATGIAAGLTSGLGGLVAKTTAVAAGWGTLGASLAASGQAFNLATKATAGTEQILGQVLATLGQMPATWGAAAVAAMAFAPQVAKAGAALNDAVGEKATKSIAATVQQFNSLNEQVKFTAASFQDLIKGSTLNQLNAQLQDATHQVGEYRSNTEKARISAQQLVTVTRAQAAEQRAINDLVRKARGITQTELEESKAIKALETKRRKQAYLNEEANKYNLEIDEYNRLAREAAEVTKKWEQSLRGVNSAAKAGVLGSTSQIRARLQEMRENRRSAEIARERSAAFMGTSGPMQGPGALGAVARAEANRVALRQQAIKLLEKERQKAQQNFQLMQNWTNVLRKGPEILADMQRLRAKELQDRKDSIALAAKELSLTQENERLTAQAARKKKLGAAAQNALIGGAFPLLFGQTGAAAIGGGIGGAIGGLVGGQLGFGLSLLGTFIGDLIDKAKHLEQNVASLNSRLVNTGRNSITTAQDVRELASALRMQNDEVVNLIAAFARFDDGDQREALASIFAGIGDEATFTKLAQAGLNQKNALDAIFALRTQIGNEEARSLAITLTQNGALITQQKLQELLVEESIKAKVAAASQINEWDSIRGAIAQSIVLIAEFVRFTQNFKLPGMDFGPKVDTSTLDSLINKYKGMDAQFFASQRGKQVEADLRARVKSILDALKEETDLLALQGGLQDKLNGKIDNTLGNLQIQLTLKEKLRELSIRQAAAARDGNTILMDALAMDAVLLQREAAIKTARLESKNLAEEELRIKIATADADQKLADILFNRKQADADLEKKAEKTMSGLQNQLELEQARLEGKGKEVELEQRAAEIAAGNKNLSEDAVLAVLKQIDAAKQLVAEQERMKQVFADIGMTIKDGVVDAIGAAVEGTKTLGEVASNMLRNIANRLLDVAVNMAMFGVPMGVGTGGGLLGGLFKADGGQVQGGKSYIVGEKGPELFTPGASGMITPNHALGGGTSNIVVNVDASGSNVEGSADQASQLGKAIGLAVQQELVKQKRPGGLLA